MPCLQGLAFTEEERKAHKLRGLLPPAVRTQKMQIDIFMTHIREQTNELGKYMLMRDLQDQNKHLFYEVLRQHTHELMPVVYTPTVGLACQKYSLLFSRPRGLFITIRDAGHVAEILNNYPESQIKAIVVTDGERILGLGDLGANGMGISVGKMALYSAIGGIRPEWTLPVTIDVGTNNEVLLAEESYIGLRQKRVTGPEYDNLIDEFMQAVADKWGKDCLVQFEDFGNKNAFRLLEKYQKNYCTFNDDIQGTASVAVGGVFSSLRATGTKLNDHRFLFLGAGEAALGIADLIVMALRELGLSDEQARQRVSLIDSKGLVTSARKAPFDAHKAKYANALPETTELIDIVGLVKPTCLIGVAAIANAFNESVIKKMTELNDRPIIFALSNPTTKAECTAETAYKHSRGKAIFASGSPFSPVTIEGKTFVPGQGNNAYIFPGIALAVIAAHVHTIPNEVFLVAARALSEEVSAADIARGSVYPALERITESSLKIATKVCEWFFAQGLAQNRPEPEDKYQFLTEHLYDASYNKMLL